MPKYALLNNVIHKDLRVIRRFGAEFGDNVGTILTFPTEYADVQREYPIFFRKDPASNEYQSVALLGFEKNENLFLDADVWRANYIPGIVAKGPFLIGFQEQEVDGNIRKEPVIHVDVEHPRVSRTEGEAVFLPQGGNSPFLNYISNVLRGIRDGIEISKAMFAAFQEFELIEPVKVEVKLNENEAYNLVGLETINQTKLATLSGTALERLNRAGFLQGAFLVAASLNNVQRLMAMKQRKQQQARA